MTVNIAFGATSDGGVSSHHATYATARNGSSLGVTATSIATFGQSYDYPYSGEYAIDEAFFQFAFTVASTDNVDVAYFQFVGSETHSTGVDREAWIDSYDWSTSLDTGDFRSTSTLGTYTTLAEIPSSQGVGSGIVVRAGSEQLAALLAGSGNVRIMVYTDRQYYGSVPSGDERTAFYSADQSGTTYDPRLVYVTRPKSTLDGALGAQVQLSDGTHVYVELSDALASPYGKLQHATAAGAITTVSTGLLSTLLAVATTTTGLQELSLARDSLDNLYLVIGSGDAVQAQAFLKGPGYSWTQKTALTGSLPTYDAFGSYINQTACAWHSVGGTKGTLAVAASHAPGRGDGSFQAYALLSCDALLAGSGTLLRGSGSGTGWLYQPSTSDWVNYQNETGTGLDIAAAPGTSNAGFVVSYNRSSQLSFAKYTLSSGGTSMSAVALGTDSSTIVKDANSKVRVLPINSTTFALVSGDRIVVKSVSTSWFGSTYNTVSSVSLGSQSMATFPTAATLRATAAWDAVYDSSSGEIWYYYFSVADGRRLMRTSFNVSSGLPELNEDQVSAAVGASGSTNLAIRTTRGALAGHSLRIAVANRSSGGTLSTVYVGDDTLDAPPDAPTLTPRANYDATASALFAWTFSDPNPSDSQSAYQLDINTAAGVDVYDSGKVTSGTSSRTLTGATLTNGVSYQWRVKTWDAADQEGAWSGFGTFSTAAGGSVTITDPASDNPPGIVTDDYLLTWSVTGTTQAAYRVVVVRTADSAEVLNTGWVASVATSYQLTGLPTGLEQDIQVTVRNAGMVESAVGHRLITPDYGEPENPVVTTVAVNDDGYILVSVANPIPGSVALGTSPYTFEAGVSQFTPTNATFVQDATQFHTGSKSGKLTVVGSPGQAHVRTTMPTYGVAVLPGRRYTVSYWAYAPVTHDTLTSAIDWYDASGVYISTTSASQAIAATTWVQQSYTGTSPVGAAFAAYGATLGNSPATGKVLHIDELILVAANDYPAIAYNQILRRVAGVESAYLVLGQAEENGTFRDYTAASGVTYQYIARAVGV